MPTVLPISETDLMTKMRKIKRTRGKPANMTYQIIATEAQNFEISKSKNVLHMIPIILKREVELSLKSRIISCACICQDQSDFVQRRKSCPGVPPHFCGSKRI